MNRSLAWYAAHALTLAVLVAWVAAMIALADRLQPGSFPQ